MRHPTMKPTHAICPVIALCVLLMSGACDCAAPQSNLRRPSGGRDILFTALSLDLGDDTATADLTFAPGGDADIALEASGLRVARVRVGGRELRHWHRGGLLSFAMPEGETTVQVDYAFDSDVFRGSNDGTGARASLVNPYDCGRLFPCDSSPSDGTGFSVETHGVPDGLVAVHAESVSTDAPSYMVAVAVGDYTHHVLGVTSHGTEVGLYVLPGDDEAANRGAAALVDYFEFFEDTLGAYAFGDRVASVSTRNSPFLGMEHHPYWHVLTEALGKRNTHAHEAAHGWFGNGVRFACWEDFVLSEGVTTYYEVRAIEHVHGIAAADALWEEYGGYVDGFSGDPTAVAWLPESCNAIDITRTRLWSHVPYVRGAFFLRALENEISRATLDAAMSSFYTSRVGTAARMQELLDTIHAHAGFDPGPLAQFWLALPGAHR